MLAISEHSKDDLVSNLLADCYSLIKGAEFGRNKRLISHWKSFSSSWADLRPDKYLPGGSTYRSRRYSHLLIESDSRERTELPNRGYLQTRDVNSAAGGIVRSFSDIKPEVMASPALISILELDLEILDRLKFSEVWHVDVHQVRTVATKEAVGSVVPEGIHQDGLEFICTHLVQRVGVEGGVSGIYNLEREKLFSATLEEPLDTIYALDEEVMHDASPITVSPAEPEGYRDTLLIGFRSVEQPVRYRNG